MVAKANVIAYFFLNNEKQGLLLFHEQLCQTEVHHSCTGLGFALFLKMALMLQTNLSRKERGIQSPKLLILLIVNLSFQFLPGTVSLQHYYK